MQKIYFFVQFALCFCTLFPKSSKGQDCSSLNATFTTYESRCAATGSISVHALGGSGSYKYKTTGPVNSNFTTSDSITGLAAGTYSVIVNDLVTNCTFVQGNVIVAGSYQDPRFTITGINVSCDNGSNGSIIVNGQQFGRSPFTYTIVAPSPTAIGTTNNTGIFSNLSAGDYSIKMTDSCGGIQTRSITINNYNWWIDSYPFVKMSCDEATGSIKVIDSRGNVSTLGQIPGFMYGVVRSIGDTIWSADPYFTFYPGSISSVDVIAKDACGTIKKANTPLIFSPSVGAIVQNSNYTCNSFTASLTGVTNFINGNFCLYDINDVQLDCNNTGIFSNIPYGSYCIKAHNTCPDTTIERCFTALPPPISVANNVMITNKNCTSFSVSITGQNGLTNPDYCLFDSSDVLISCNNTGTFNNLLNGSYCINITDGCRDTTISRCFHILKPRPIIPAVTPSYIDCKNISIHVGGDSLYFPQYCLYDTSGVLINCNNTGIFDSLTIGNQCVSIYDACYDTTITRCFIVGKSIIVNDLTANISNANCSTFTVTGSGNNLTEAHFCLYAHNDTLISCNNTGIFNNIAFGNYCIKVKNDCPDTLFTTCFTVSPPVPSVNENVLISNKNCTSFSANVYNQDNLTNPQFCILDSNNVQISCNSTGIFNDLIYGRYCINIINTCYDTIITRCFNVAPLSVSISVISSKSCSYGYAKLGIDVTGGNLPVNIKIYSDSSTIFNRNYTTDKINIDSIPGSVLGNTYKVIATDNCGNTDTAYITSTASIATHSPKVFAQCPSAEWQNGSGKIELTTTTNMGNFTVRIIAKDGGSLNPEFVPNAVSAGKYTFNDMGTGTYIVRYLLNDNCNQYLYDTVKVEPYYYPNLNRSSAYQCDVSGFSVGAVASNGVGPFSYEIIGSSPSFPSINAGPQANPVFSIDNGNNYSLIRLRALDACGNATLGDASILPMANYRIDADSNCFQSSSTLSVDTIYNATYAWYKKRNNYNDSIYLGAGYAVYIPFVAANDTGTYVCYVTVNTGCVKRAYFYNLTGMCYAVLPVTINAFAGKLSNGHSKLNWQTLHETDLKNYIVERSINNNIFKEIGMVKTKPNSSVSADYDFVDINPGIGQNVYRLKLLFKNLTFAYSKVITLTKSATRQFPRYYPNPVLNNLTISFENSTRHMYKISLLNMANQPLWETNFINGNNNLFQIPRPASISKGVYVLRCVDLNTNEEYAEEIIFL